MSTYPVNLGTFRCPCGRNKLSLLKKVGPNSLIDSEAAEKSRKFVTNF